MRKRIIVVFAAALILLGSWWAVYRYGEDPWLYLRITTTIADGQSARSISASPGNIEHTGLTQLKIPDQYEDGSPITRIAAYGFSGCATLKAVTLPRNLTQLGSYSFSGCTSLESIIIPDGVEVIPDGAFLDCRALTEVTLPSGLLQISSSAFENCTELESITIPTSVYAIARDSFFGCGNLSKIVLEHRENLDSLYWPYSDALDGQWNILYENGGIVMEATS